MFKVEKRATLKDQALNQIRNAISDGWFKPGDRINEGKLAADMGMSRFPVREAITCLEGEGLVVTIPFKGTFINKLNKKDLEELYTLRILLETHAIEALIQTLTPEKEEALSMVLEDMQDGIQKNQKDIATEDLKFHEKICELSGNGKLLEVWRNLSAQIRLFLIFEQQSYEDITHLYDSHKLILDMIKTRDKEKSAAEIRKNIQTGLDRILDTHLFD